MSMCDLRQSAWEWAVHIERKLRDIMQVTNQQVLAENATPSPTPAAWQRNKTKPQLVQSTASNMQQQQHKLSCH
jgi:hypothetical protein